MKTSRLGGIFFCTHCARDLVGQGFKFLLYFLYHMNICLILFPYCIRWFESPES
jgi:hypothetical protein